MKIKVGVVFGGKTVEHEVSIITALQAMNKMDREKYDIIPIYITKSGEWYTGTMLSDIEVYQDLGLIKKYATNVILCKKDGVFVLQSKGFLKKVVTELDIVFPMTHGTNVEDGALQGYFQTVGIPYVGPNVYAAAVGQDKAYMRDIFKANNLPIPEYVWFYDSEYRENDEEVLKKIEKIKYPVIVKPATTGSSVGIGISNNREELVKNIDEALQYDSKIVVEEVISPLTEVNVSVLGNYEHQELSTIEEVGSQNEILTYEDKYTGGKKGPSKGMASARRKIPANISEKLAHDVEEMALRAFRALNSSGVVRIDFLIDMETEKVYVNEINSIPGSLSFYLWEKTNKEYPELLEDIINLGIVNYKNKNKKTITFKNNILEGFNGLKGVKGIKGIKK